MFIYILIISLGKTPAGSEQVNIRNSPYSKMLITRGYFSQEHVTIIVWSD
jgi:hypothetical protein